MKRVNIVKGLLVSAIFVSTCALAIQEDTPPPSNYLDKIRQAGQPQKEEKPKPNAETNATEPATKPAEPSPHLINQPTTESNSHFSDQPSAQPAAQPSAQPSTQPSTQPTAEPSGQSTTTPPPSLNSKPKSSE